MFLLSTHTERHKHAHGLWHEEDESRREQVLPTQTLTHAVDAGVVQVVAEGALAAEGTIGVNAGSVYAHTQVL